jgi:multicomponent Na+:H+ antiporter subunit A
MRRYFPLDESVSVIFYVLVLGSVYLLFAGHNQPGGGFVGGLVAGAAVALRYVAGGIDEVRRVSPVRPWTMLGAGLFVAATTATVPVILGGAVLDHALFEESVPVLGTVKATSALPFDIGVYFVVVGVALMVIEAFGERFVPVDRGPESDA